MKRKLTVVPRLLLLAWLAVPAVAGVPLPSVTYYGCVRDAYGYPYAADAGVALRQGGTEFSRALITGERSPGVNYRLEVEMDSGGIPYEPYAAQVGAALEVAVACRGQSVAVMTNALIKAPGIITVPAAGSIVRLDIQTGTDSDGDGLPDAWEQNLIAQSGGALRTLADVRPEADFDGDGSSNLHEFQTGTFPFLPNDCLALERPQGDANGRFHFRFLAVAGFTYQVQGSSNLTGAAWGDQPFAANAAAPVAAGLVYGDDTFRTLYVDATNAAFVRLSIK